MVQPITSKLAIITEMMEDFIRKENKALHKRNRELEDEVDGLSIRISEQNRHIAQLTTDIDGLIDALAAAQYEIDQLRGATRILYSTDGRTALFARNRHGVYVEVTDPPEEEPIRSVRRRLNFDSESSEESSDDELMTQLFGF